MAALIHISLILALGVLVVFGLLSVLSCLIERVSYPPPKLLDEYRRFEQEAMDLDSAQAD